MANNLYRTLNGGNTPTTPFGNFQYILQQYNQFKSQFQGDPRQKVQELINSGKLSQQQFNQLQMMATQFQKLMGK